MIAIEAKGLSKRIFGTSVLQNLDLAVPSGSVFGLLGRNGAGKTTLFRLLLGLARPDWGSLTVLGHDLGAAPEVRSRVGYVADSDILPSWAAVGDVVALERRLRVKWDGAALDGWCATEKVNSRRRVGNLSKGQRKRLEIELALAGRPEVLLLDEPFANLDPVAKSEMLATLLSHVVDACATVLISSHVLSDLERICDGVGVLTGGRLPIVVTMDELKEGGAIVSPREANRAGSLPPDLPVLATWLDVGGRSFVVTGLDDDRRAALATAGYRVREGNLEEMGTELLRALGAP